MDANKYLKSRKDARLVFSKNQNVIVRCLTNRCKFDASVQNVSASGIFIKTDQALPVGEEIAVSFKFPKSGNQVQAAGKVVRITSAGIGMEINIYFKNKQQTYKTRTTARKKKPKLILLGSSNPSR
jgi:Tfp pilus assembly protein PilZ